MASQSNRYREFIEQCKKQLDARDLLESLGAMNIIESGDELIHSCLIDTVVPHHEHGDSNPSASLNKTKFTYNCFSFGGGSLLWLFKILTQSKNTDQAVEVLSTYLAGDHDQSYEQVQSKIKELFADDELPEPIPHYNSSMLDAWKFIHPWLVEDRGISPRVLVRHKVGYDQTTNTVIIPHFWEKRLVGWQRRRMDSPRWFQLDNVLSKPKYQSCVDIDTEILTTRGWLCVDDLSMQDEVASVNEFGELRYSNPLQINRSFYSGNMIAINTENLNQLLTANHDVCYKAVRISKVLPDNGREYHFVQGNDKRCPRCGEWKTLDDFPVFPSQRGNYCIPCWKTPPLETDAKISKMNAEHLFDKNRGIQCYSFPVAAASGYSGRPPSVSLGGPILAELLGWIASDGCIAKYNDVRIYQSKTEYVDRIRYLLECAEIPYSEYIRTRSHTGEFPTGFRPEWVNRQYTEHIFYIRNCLFRDIAFNSLGIDKEPPWEWLKTSYDEAMAFFEGFRMGDGSSWRQDSTAISQKNERVRDFLQALCFQLGMRSKQNDRWLSVCRSRDSVLVNKTKKHQWLSQQQYDGEVWCPTTVDGTWVARRNGCVFITGNSPSFPKYHTLYNYPQPVNSILVVESPMSVLAWETLRECYDDSLPPAVATFGSGVSEKHAELLRTFDTVTVFFDHDFAGWRGALKLLSMIIDHIKCFVVFDPPENKDPAELTGREARFCIDWAVPGPLAIPILEQRVHIKHNSPQKKEK